jgi:hypothetical protein
MMFAMTHKRKTEASDVLKGALAGALGGLLASWVMNQSHKVIKRSLETVADVAESVGLPSCAEAESQQSQGQQSEDETATVKTAQAISRGLLGRELTSDEKKMAGPIVHYGYGTLMGAAYGAMSELWPATSAGCGSAYGAGLWLIGDEIAVPLLGLGSAPQDTSACVHAQALGAHLVFGLALDLVRQGVRSAL